MSGPRPTERFSALAAKVDQFFASAHARVGDAMQCVPGCADCCQGGLTVTAVEAAVITEGLATMSADDRHAISARARHADGARCAALDAENRCSIYAWRPLVCRSHGVPVQVASAMPGHLPVVQVCPKNFVDGLDEVGSENILDQGTLSTVLGAIDAVHADEVNLARGTRTAIQLVLIRAAGE